MFKVKMKKSQKINKLRKISTLSFENGIRLHRDSILLYKKRRYPSSFALSVLAQEEIGKFRAIEHYIFDEELGDDEFKEEGEEGITHFFNKVVLNHNRKQRYFIRYNVHNMNFQSSRKYVRNMEKEYGRNMELEKQNSLYVGLKGVKLNSRINNPNKIKSNIAKNQITKINDFLFLEGILLRRGVLVLENEKIEKLLRNKNFLLAISKNWIYKDKETIKKIKRMGDRIWKTGRMMK